MCMEQMGNGTKNFFDKKYINSRGTNVNFFDEKSMRKSEGNTTKIVKKYATHLLLVCEEPPRSLTPDMARRHFV